MKVNFYNHHFFVLLLLCTTMLSCDQQEEDKETLFKQLSSASTHITFSNQITENNELNILDYLYMYNGGGVAVGDINNDGFTDIYLTANQQSNKLYLNKGKPGEIAFEDITEKAGVLGDVGLNHWTTGVTMVDINSDGWLDIYVCQMHGFKNLQGSNKLFINNQDGTFSEEAAKYGLDISSYAQQAAFFDYDRDGDLDMYLLNQAVHTPESYKKAELRNKRDSLAGDRLFENVDGKFRDVSEAEGIYGGSMGYGLALGIGDIDNNGYPDIYVSNDFHENDYLYYNQGGKHPAFVENMVGSMGHNSTFSMGNDMADFNNDEKLDVISLDMKPYDETILKSSSGVDPYHIYEYKLSYGYFYQYSRNMLHLNRGSLFTDSAMQFSEIGQLAGVDATDWSWSALFADLDNDGMKDLFITNGIPRRPNDLDYIKFASNEARKVENMDALTLINTLPEGKVTNKVFQNRGLKFQDQSKNWGLDQLGVSQGAAYADLDNDGDLDLIVNNLGAEAFVYENKSGQQLQNHFLKIRFKGSTGNSLGIGSRVTLTTKTGTQMQELNLTKGWLSSMSPELFFGLGKTDTVRQLSVRWSDGKTQTLKNVSANQTLVLNHADATNVILKDNPANTKQIFQTVSAGIDFQHRENYFIDFTVEQLIPHFISTLGPKAAVGDVNGDGLEDVFIGNAKGAAGKLFLQQQTPPYFIEKPVPAFDLHKQKEDTDAVFFDADQDGDLDLYVVSGGGEPDQGAVLQDRLYLNDGKGNFSYAEKSIPAINSNASCVVAFDANQDGALDLFIGAHSVSHSYGLSPNSTLLVNDGKGGFTDQTEKLLPAAFELGMVTDAVWLPETRELAVVGEWMPITIFQFGEEITKTELPNTSGWWNTIAAADMDQDGDLDLLVGNLGENSNLKATADQPVNLYVSDFDGNFSTDPIMSYYRQGKEWMYPGLDRLAGQITKVKKTYQSYKTYAESSFNQVFSPNLLENAVHKQAQTFQSVYLENKGKGDYTVTTLPPEAQIAPIYAFAIADFDGDGNKDLLTAGNFYGNQPDEGRYDASFGSFLKGDGQGGFEVVDPQKTGFSVYGEIRNLTLIHGSEKPYVLVTRNNSSTRLFNYSIQ